MDSTAGTARACVRPCRRFQTSCHSCSAALQVPRVAVRYAHARARSLRISWTQRVAFYANLVSQHLSPSLSLPVAFSRSQTPKGNLRGAVVSAPVIAVDKHNPTAMPSRLVP
eukprot:4355288-Pleurochrysis_carterae.AAC.2